MTQVACEHSFTQYQKLRLSQNKLLVQKFIFIFVGIILFISYSCKPLQIQNINLIKYKIMEPGNLEKLRTDVLQTIDKVVRVLQSSQSHQCCYLMGLTGGGKSSFTCYMCGEHLKFKKKGMKYAINHQNKKLPQIGNTKQSCTTIPGIFKTPENMVIYDPPGFNATTGIHQEILDSYCNAKMFKVGSQAKIVIIVELPSLTSARGKGMVDVAKQLFRLFEDDFESVVNSCVLVVTKVGIDDQDIQKDIEEQIQSISELKQILGEAQMLLKSILRQNRVILFPQPGQITDNIISDIKKKINSLPFYYVTKNPLVSLSPDAKSYVGDYMKKIDKEKIETLKLVDEEVLHNFKRKKLTTTDELANQLGNIRSAMRMIASGALTFFQTEKTKELGKILEINKKYIDKLIELASQLQFCLSINISGLDMNAQYSYLVSGSLVSIQKQIEKQMIKIATKEEIQKINKKHQQQRQREYKANQKRIQDMQRQNQKRHKILREQADRKNKQNLERLKEQNKEHAKEMSELQKSLMAQHRQQIEKIKRQRQKEIEQMKQKIAYQQKQFQRQSQLKQKDLNRLQSNLFVVQRELEDKTRRQQENKIKQKQQINRLSSQISLLKTESERKNDEIKELMNKSRQSQNKFNKILKAVLDIGVFGARIYQAFNSTSPSMNQQQYQQL